MVVGKIQDKVQSKDKKKMSDKKQKAVEKAMKLAQVGSYFMKNEWIFNNKSLDELLSVLTIEEKNTF